MNLNEAISPTEVNYYWDMFMVDVIRTICHRVKAQRVFVVDKNIVDKQTDKIYTAPKNGG